MNEKLELHPLTPAQSEFAAQNHDLVFRYLQTHGLSEDEFYSEVILGYLAAVQRYSERPWLRKYGFQPVAFALMDSAAASYLADRDRLRAKEISLQEPALRELAFTA